MEGDPDGPGGGCVGCKGVTKTSVAAFTWNLKKKRRLEVTKQTSCLSVGLLRER